MFKNYKVVCVTPPGRKRYLRLLIPQIIISDIVDRFEIWVNTQDKGDLEFLTKVAEEYSKIKLIPQLDGKVDGIKSIGAFFKTATDANTIYIRLDDDIVWLEPNFFETIVQNRIDNPDYFLITPLVINNAASSFILQRSGKYDFYEHYTPNCFDLWGWKRPEAAIIMHNWFINKIKTNEYKSLYIGKMIPMSLCRFSINSIVWFGEEFQKFNGEISKDEEYHITVVKPFELNKLNAVCTDTVVAHFSFYTQREKIEKENILEEYDKMVLYTYGNNIMFERVYNNLTQIARSIPESKPNELRPFHRLIKKIYFKLNRLIKKIYFKLKNI